MPRKIRSRIVKKEITVVKQTMEELVEDNKDYIEHLRQEHGQKAVDKFIRHLEYALTFVPPTGTKEQV